MLRRHGGEALLLAGVFLALGMAMAVLVQPPFPDREASDPLPHLASTPVTFDGVVWGSAAEGPGASVARAEALLHRATAALLVLVALSAGLGQLAASAVRTASRRPEARVCRAVGAPTRRLLRDRGRRALECGGLGLFLGGLLALPAASFLQGRLSPTTADAALLAEVPRVAMTAPGVLLPALALAAGALLAWVALVFGVVQSGERLPGGPLHPGTNLAEPHQGERGHPGAAVLQVAGATAVLVAAGLMGIIGEERVREEAGARFLASAAPGDAGGLVDLLLAAGGETPLAVTSPGFWEGLGITRLTQTECGECYIPGSPPVRTRVKGEAAVHHAVSPDTFRMAGIILLEGRAFEAHDTAGSEPVAVVSRAFALEHFQDGEAVGRRIRLGTDPRWHTVVGVIEALPRRRLAARQQPPHDVLVPVSQAPPVRVEVVTAGVPVVLPPLPGTLRPVASPRERDRLLADWTAGFVVVWRLGGMLGAAVALLGLSLTVGRRVREEAREMAMHRALGATRSRILTRYAGVGLGVGALGSLLGCWASLFVAGALIPEAFALAGVTGSHMLRVAFAMTVSSAVVALTVSARATRGSVRAGLG